MVDDLFDHLLLIRIQPKVFPFWGGRPDFLSIVLHPHGGVGLRATENIIGSHGLSLFLTER